MVPSQVNAYYSPTENKIGKITLYCFLLFVDSCVVNGFVVNLDFLLLAFERYATLISQTWYTAKLKT